MDLPLATPELDHDALRFSLLFPAQQKIKDEGYSPSPDIGKQSRMKVTLLLLIFITPYIFQGFSSLFRDPHRAHCSLLTTFPLLPISVCKVACGTNSIHLWSGLRVVMDGWFTPIPSLTLEEPPHLPI
jgi:hypothetical protein